MKNKIKLVLGVGINDADYSIAKSEKVNGKWRQVWMCPFYNKWKGMLERCYSPKCQKKQPTYKDCIVCDEWLYFSNFKKWMETQEWEDRQLDKDFLIEGNKIYSANTCIFIPASLNSFTTTHGAKRGVYPLGASYKKKNKKMTQELSKPYYSVINNQTGRQTHLGAFSTPEEAHHRYLHEKLKQCINYIQEFRDEPLTIKGLTRIKNKIQYHISNGLELTEF